MHGSGIRGHQNNAFEFWRRPKNQKAHLDGSRAAKPEDAAELLGPAAICAKEAAAALAAAAEAATAFSAAASFLACSLSICRREAFSSSLSSSSSINMTSAAQATLRTLPATSASGAGGSDRFSPAPDDDAAPAGHGRPSA